MSIIDARGLSCPEPVIMIQKAMATKENKYAIVVDNPTSKENVMRFAEHHGYKVSYKEADGEFTLTMEK